MRKASPHERLDGERGSSLRESFIADAEASAKEIDAGGALYRGKDVHAYIRARTAGAPARRPTPIRSARRR